MKTLSTQYRPRRASQRWLEGAPEYVLAVYDSGPKDNDRYTVLFGGTMLDDVLLKHRKVHMLGFNAAPTNPAAGVSQWGEIEAAQRAGLGKKITWTDLSPQLRAHVIARATA